MIFDQLKRDHEVLRALMEKIVATASPSSRSTKFKEFVEQFSLHSKAEEMFFYQAILRGEFGDDLSLDQALESLDDHIAMENSLAEIEDTEQSSSAWIERFKFFRRAFERHMIEEEKVLFKLGRRLISKSEALELGEAFADVKESKLSR